MNFNYQDIDNLIKRYSNNPNKDDYFFINNWYNENLNTGYVDNNYLICVYLFLLGANIRHQYIPYTREQNKDWIAEIRNLIENAEPLHSSQRNIYLNYGTKAGYYK
jgi:hypothetical protein